MADPPKTRLRVAKTVGVAKGVVQFFIIPERVDGFAWTKGRFLWSFSVDLAGSGSSFVSVTFAGSFTVRTNAVGDQKPRATDVRSFAISGAPKGAPTIATATAHGAHASADQLQA